MAAIIALAICFIITHLLTVFPFAEANNGGCFTTDLIHRDSLHSPFYNPSETPTERFHNAHLRSISRLNNHFNSKEDVASPAAALPAHLVPAGGEYYVNISIGTPQVQLIGIVDTGSDLSWIQCEPCIECYKQNPPIFDPGKSSTSKNITCESKPCSYLGKDERCDENHNTCQYYYSYADGSYASGNVGTESFTIPSKTGHPVTFQDIVFGCSNNSTGTYNETGSGIVGLGDGPLSLISQIRESIQAKFSYCLVPPSAQGNAAASKISFGDTAGSVTGSEQVIETRLVHKEASTYYHVTLEAISVGSTRVEYFTGNATNNVGEEGNMIIDTGTTFTFLDPQFYKVLATVLLKEIGKKRVKDPRGYASVCFGVENEDGDSVVVIPSITFHFGGGADLKLHRLNAFARLVEEKLMCLNMLPVDPIGVFGNLCQTNFLIQFDVVKRTVSFVSSDCTEQ